MDRISFNGSGGWRPAVAAGINKSHGSSLCLVDDEGMPIFCASEERFTRVKLQRGMPHLTLRGGVGGLSDG